MNATEARAAYAAAIAATEAATEAIDAANRAYEIAVTNAQIAHHAVLAAEAAEAADSLPVGTVVRHRTYRDMTGVVVPNDGTGIAVRQDDFDTVKHGYGPGEWVAI
jgi:hypothetical protein